MLIKAGKKHWITKREDLVTIRGKTDIITYWIKDNRTDLAPRRASTQDDDQTSLHDSETTRVVESNPKERFERLVEWNVATLLRLVKEIMSNRMANTSQGIRSLSSHNKGFGGTGTDSAGATSSPLQEVKEIITLPEFKHASTRKPFSEIQVSQDVVEQLRMYVSCIANMYR